MTFDQTRSQIEQRLDELFERERDSGLSFAVVPRGADGIDVQITVSREAGMAFGTVSHSLEKIDHFGVGEFVTLVARKARELAQPAP